MIEALEATLSKNGLLNRGGFNDDTLKPHDIDFDAKAVVLVGVAGSDFWPIFKTSPEFSDGKANPMDRWSKRIGDAIANDCSAQAVYPSDGPPYYPFITWAKQCETVHSSKMGFSIHPEFGLWHAYRFALIFPNRIDSFDLPTVSENPCVRCVDSPCLSNCPVNAYSTEGFDPECCFDYLQTDAGEECKTKGCMTRRACPEGKKYRYTPEHAEFHMMAFYDSRQKQSTLTRDTEK